jgi:cytoskeletal protein CcmA (bactofilin family)
MKNGKTDQIPLDAFNKISEGTFIQGEVNSAGDIRIDGKVKGTLRSKAKVVIGTSGEVEGDLNCHSADIHGLINGTVRVRDILYLKSTSRISGDIFSKKLVIESGAVFDGKCSMSDVPEATNGETSATISQPTEAEVV